LSALFVVASVVVAAAAIVANVSVIEWLARYQWRFANTKQWLQISSAGRQHFNQGYSLFHLL
jgi:membrane protein YdbS with pleckstrin-like domain